MGLILSEVARVAISLSPLFRFVHGLAFFMLGIGIFFAMPRMERIEPIRRLPLLAVFALCEAVVAWDGLLAPALGMAHVFPPLVQTFLLGPGYGTLLIFGLMATMAAGQRPLRRSAPFAAVGIWVLLTAALALAGCDAAFWGEVLARYGLALPGGLVAMWSLHSRFYRRADPRVLELTRASRRITGVGLGSFAFLAGLVLPSIAFLPQTPGTTALRYLLSLLLTCCGVIVSYGLSQTLNCVQREVERWIERDEQRQALASDRERIGRELHDGIIQSIYAAGLMLEGVRQTIAQDPVSAEDQLARAMHSLNLTIQDIRRYIFDLRGGVPESDLVEGLEELLRDFRVNTLLETELRVEGESSALLSVERRRHVLQIVREALSNVARHARARRVEVSLRYLPDALQLVIRDDGVGLLAIPTAHGHGLRNIRERARMLDGTLDIDSAPGHGLTLTLTVPYLRGEVA